MSVNLTRKKTNEEKQNFCAWHQFCCVSIWIADACAEGEGWWAILGTVKAANKVVFEVHKTSSASLQNVQWLDEIVNIHLAGGKSWLISESEIAIQIRLTASCHLVFKPFHAGQLRCKLLVDECTQLHCCKFCSRLLWRRIRSASIRNNWHGYSSVNRSKERLCHQKFLLKIAEEIG